MQAAGQFGPDRDINVNALKAPGGRKQEELFHHKLGINFQWKELAARDV